MSSEVHIRVEVIKIDDDDGRFIIAATTEDGEILNLDIHDSVLEFYDSVRREIGPYAHEAESARKAVAQGMSRADYLDTPQPVSSRPVSVEDAVDAGYALDDPKHPGWHSTHADLWDAREGK